MSASHLASSKQCKKSNSKAVKADEALQEELKAATDVDAVVAIAKAAGFVISTEELNKAQAELSDEELAGVAGGNDAATRAAQPSLVRLLQG